MSELIHAEVAKLRIESSKVVEKVIMMVRYRRLE